MEENKRKRIIKIILLILLAGICISLILSYFLYDRFQDAGRGRGLVWFVMIYAIYDIYRELKKDK